MSVERIFLVFLSVLQFVCIALPNSYTNFTAEIASSVVHKRFAGCSDAPNVTMKKIFEGLNLIVVSALLTFEHESCAADANCELTLGGPKIRSYPSTSSLVGNKLNISTVILGPKYQGSLPLSLTCYNADGSLVLQDSELL